MLEYQIAPSRHPDTKAGIPRSVEAVLSLLGLVLCAPFLALLALAVAVISPGPVVFRQERVGRKGRTFILYKLRTMRLAQGGPQVTASGDHRLTRLGKLLRKTKLDELPELWNVLKGDMSLVGPRPEVPRYVNPADSMWGLVLEAKPGLTDPMTLRLRNEEGLLAKVKGDRENFYRELLQPFKLKGYLEYLQRRSWRSDVKVLWKTSLAIIFPGKAPPPTVEEILTFSRAAKLRLNRSATASKLSRSSEARKVEAETAKIASLGEREREVITLVAEGLKNKEIAERLFISETTVRHHLTSIFNKLDVSNRLELIIFLFRHKRAFGLDKASEN